MPPPAQRFNPHLPEEGTPLELLPRMTLDERQYLLAALLTHRDLFAKARARLEPMHFCQGDEAHFLVLYSVILSVVDCYGEDVLFGDREAAWQILDMQTHALLERSPGILPPAFEPALFGREPPGFLPYYYRHCRCEEFLRDAGERLLARFLKERTVHDRFQSLALASSSTVLGNFAPLAQDLLRTNRELDYLTFDPVASAAPPGWLPPVYNFRPTGIGFVDEFFQGGQQPGEVYSVLGTKGSGKSTLVQQLAVSVAALEQLWARGPEHHPRARVDDPKSWGSLGWPYTLGHCYLFHYEMGQNIYRHKLWSCASFVDYYRLSHLGEAGFQLSTTTALNDAEAALYRLSIGSKDLSVIPSERERLERALRLLAVNVHQIDCSGSTHPAVGAGYVSEIAAILAQERSKGHRIAFVGIDYGGACVDRHTLDRDMAYSLLTQMGRRCSSEIAEPFQTPVWLFHQLSGEANARSSSLKQHHSQAAGSKRFTENCSFAFNIASADEMTGCRWFNCSVSRWNGIGPARILKVAGAFNRLVDVSDYYQFDSRGRIRSRNAMLEAVHRMEPRDATPPSRLGSADPSLDAGYRNN
jgi:hypothetical protein